MIATTLTSVDGMEFTARSDNLLTTEEIREWERHITWDTETIIALDEVSGMRFRRVEDDWQIQR